MTASLGLRSKTGRAIAVILREPLDAPRVLLRADLVLFDPKVPDTKQPHHAVMHLPWQKAESEALKTAVLIHEIAANELGRLLDQARSDGFKVCGAGIVGSADRDLARIGNYHIRAHAAEGILFRAALTDAAATNGLRSQAYPEKALFELAQTRLRRPEAELKRLASLMGRGIVRPWRADEKTATVAAWLALSAFGRLK